MLTLTYTTPAGTVRLEADNDRLDAIWDRLMDWGCGPETQADRLKWKQWEREHAQNAVKVRA